MKLEDLEKKYEELGKEIDKLKAEQQPAEWPQVGDMYWCTNTYGNIGEYLYEDGDVFTQYHESIGDMHRTKEEAEAYRAYRMNPRTVMRDRIQMFVDEYNGGERGLWEVDESGNTVEPGAFGVTNPFTMKDRKGAELLLKKFGLENILWACGGAAPSEDK